MSRRPDRAWLAITGLLLLSALPVIGGVLRLSDVPAAAGMRPAASSVAAVAHIVGMTIYCLLGAFQFSPALRGRRRWHRTTGRALIPVAFVAGLGAAWLAIFFTGPTDQLPLAMVRLVFASAMIVFLVLGTTAIVRRDVAAHGDWMTRAYAIGVGNGTQSLVVILWTVPLGEVDAWGETWLVATGTLITALVAEILIQRRAVRRGSAASARARLYPHRVTGLLRSAWSAPSAMPPPPRRIWRDGALVAVVALAAVAEGILRTDLPHPLLSVVAVLAVLPTVLWRRVHPLWMLVIVLVPVDLILPTSLLYAGMFVLVMVYALFRWGSGRDLVVGSALIIVTLALTLVRGSGLDEVVGGTTLLLATVLLGVVIRSRAGAQQRLLDQVRVLEREQLARDLHDTVAHHVSAITIRAQAGLAVAERNPRAALDALVVIETEAGRTLNELRSIVRVLRQDDAAELTPNPQLSDIQKLAGARPGGAAVSVTINGQPGILLPPVAAAVFRIAQESVTNALRHAHGVTRVDVWADVDDRGVRLRVTNDGDIAPATTPGFGIIGMMERAALLGGTCTAGPLLDGGWIVSAELPCAGWAS